MTSSSYDIRPLDDLDKRRIHEHLLRLSPEDRHLRFCVTVSDDFIRRYVFTMMDLQRDTAYGAFLGDELVGMANIVVVNDSSCELAFTINAEHRGTGLARKLMRLAIDRCAELGATKLCMSCLRQNRKMQALATSFGLNTTITYDEAYAELGITR